jgi:hypothetical protein
VHFNCNKVWIVFFSYGILPSICSSICVHTYCNKVSIVFCRLRWEGRFIFPWWEKLKSTIDIMLNYWMVWIWERLPFYQLLYLSLFIYECAHTLLYNYIFRICCLCCLFYLKYIENILLRNFMSHDTTLDIMHRLNHRKHICTIFKIIN